jgi:membrane fusion protein (multidrug efflux system)
VTDVIRAIRVDSGDRVARGQVLVEMASVEQSADLEEAKAAAVAAERQYERFAQLGERGFAPAARVEAERAAFERAQARVDALQSRIADRLIRAPFAGIVGLRTASPGALVRPGDAITTLDDISLIKLDFDIAESQLGDVRVGAAIAARTAAFPDREFTGVVRDIDSRVNAQTRTIRVRAEIPNRDGALKPGMLMTVQVRSNPRETLAVPEMALIDRSDGAFVFVVQARGEGPPVAVLSEVKTGARQNGLVEIQSGLEPGARIIVEGVQRARSGQPVRVEQPDGLRPAQATDQPPTKKAS